MFEEIENMSKGLYKDMMKDVQEKNVKMQMGRVNFVIEKPLKDGRVLKANSYNPILLLKAFDEFVKRAEGSK